MKKSNFRFTALLVAVLSFFSMHSVAQKLIPLPNFKPSWVQDYKPFRIAGNLYYVGSYDLGCYLIKLFLTVQDMIRPSTSAIRII